MIDEKFDVIFRGQIVKGKDVNDVKSSLVSLFKSSLKSVEPLFSGADIKIKKSLDYSTAMKYQTVLKQAGALAIIREVVIAKPKANFMTANEDTEPEETSSTPVKPAIKPVVEVNKGLTMANVGAQIMPDKVYEKRNVDTSELSLAKLGERILPAKIHQANTETSIDHLSLEEI